MLLELRSGVNSFVHWYERMTIDLSLNGLKRMNSVICGLVRM